MKITIDFERKKKEKRKDVPRVTYTKKWISTLLALGCTWISLSYVLAFMGMVQIAEALSQTVAQIIIATVIGYLCKSFFETREEELLKYKREKDRNIYHSSETSEETEV